MNRILYVFIILISIVHTQTFFTIPRSVWRISIINSIGSGNWIGSGGLFNKGIRDMSYMANDSTVAAYVHQMNKMNKDKVEDGLRMMLEGLGIDLNDTHFRETPKRAMKAWSPAIAG